MTMWTHLPRHRVFHLHFNKAHYHRPQAKRKALSGVGRRQWEGWGQEVEDICSSQKHQNVLGVHQHLNQTLPGHLLRLCLGIAPSFLLAKGSSAHRSKNRFILLRGEEKTMLHLTTTGLRRPSSLPCQTCDAFGSLSVPSILVLARWLPSHLSKSNNVILCNQNSLGSIQGWDTTVSPVFNHNTHTHCNPYEIWN